MIHACNQFNTLMIFIFFIFFDIILLKFYMHFIYFLEPNCNPPGPTRMHKGTACALPFSRERVYFGLSLGNISRESPKRGVFLSNCQWGDMGNILFPRYGGGGGVSGDGERSYVSPGSMGVGGGGVIQWWRFDIFHKVLGQITRRESGRVLNGLMIAAVDNAVGCGLNSLNQRTLGRLFPGHSFAYKAVP